MTTTDPTTPPEPADALPGAPRNPSPGEIADATLTARAERAERQAAELEARLTQAHDDLETARAALIERDRAHDLDLALSAAGAVDLDTARLLAQRAALEAPDADPTDLITRLAREKPFLFRRRAHPASAMAPMPDNPNPLLTSTRQAAAAGDRTALLDYLRARRSA